MIRVTLLCLLFITLVRFGDAINIINKIKNGNSLDLGQKHIIKKCCPFGQYVQKKQCLNHNASKDFSSLKVYDKNIYETNKSFNDVFIITDGMFQADEEFQNHSINVRLLDFEPYIIEDGSLQLNLPNMYPLWTPVPSGKFCLDYVITRSNKLTRFPMFWSISEGKNYEDSDDYLTAASLVSCVFMLLVLLVYGLLPELQNLCGLILMAYVASLCMAFMLLAIIQLFRHTEGACIGLTLGIYYFFLASFCWMTVMSYDIWWTFRGYAKARPIHRRGEHFKFLMYCLYAFGVPFLMTIGLGVLDQINMKSVPWFITPHLLTQGCFLEGMVKMLYLYTPLLILNVCNWLFYLMTAFNLWRLNRATAILDSAAAGTPAAHRTQMHRFMVYLKLAVVMGLNWLLEVVSYLYPGSKIWYYTDIYNILIGFIIFLIFVCKKKIFRKLYKRYALKSTRRFYPGSSKSYSSSSSASDSNHETTTLQICSNPKGMNGYTVTRNY